MISLEEARSDVLSVCRPLAPLDVTLPDALGLVLAEEVRAEGAVPPFASSSMDGYALRSTDIVNVPARLRITGSLMAGDDPASTEVGPGEAVRIMTGAALPRGADAVCMVERTVDGPDGTVLVQEPVTEGGNVRPLGDDVQAGEMLFGPGELLGPFHLGVLTSAGVEEVRCHPCPRVGVVSTGDELVSAPAPLGPAQIWDSNRPALLAALRADGFGAIDLGKAPDDEDELAAVITQATLRCDAVLTSGGVSVGDRDLVKVVLGQLGGQQARWSQVAVKPAKPFAFSPVGPMGTPIFGLPGNPVSALISYELFARPALRLMAGHRLLGRPLLRASAGEEMGRARDGRLHLVRVVVSRRTDGQLEAVKAGGQGSHHMLALARANALALLPDGEGVSKDGALDIWLLGPGPLSA